MSFIRVSRRRLLIVGSVLLLMIGVGMTLRPTGPASVDRNSSPEPPDLANHAVIHVLLTGYQPGQGTISLAVFQQASGFPEAEHAEMTLRTATSSQPEMGIEVEVAGPGTYALAAYQDMNGDRQLNKARIGYPLEPFGFSRKARSLLGPPAFASAAFEVTGASSTVQVVLEGLGSSHPPARLSGVEELIAE